MTDVHLLDEYAVPLCQRQGQIALPLTIKVGGYDTCAACWAEFEAECWRDWLAIARDFGIGAARLDQIFNGSQT